MRSQCVNSIAATGFLPSKSCLMRVIYCYSLDEHILFHFSFYLHSAWLFGGAEMLCKYNDSSSSLRDELKYRSYELVDPNRVVTLSDSKRTYCAAFI